MKSMTFLINLLIVASLVLGGCGEKSTATSEYQARMTVMAIQPDGQPANVLQLVWRFDIADEWHLYSAGRNDSGFPPTVALELPTSWTAAELQWPAPTRHLSEGDILDHVYFGELVLLQEITMSEDADLSAGFEISGVMSWLACRGMCVPGEADVLIRSVSDVPADYAEIVSQLPQRWDETVLQSHWDGAVLQVVGPSEAQLTFMPNQDCGRLVDLIADGVGPELAVRFQTIAELPGPARGLITIESEGVPRRVFLLDVPAHVLESESSGG